MSALESADKKEQPEIEAITKQVYSPEESEEILKYLQTKTFEYHKQYKRYNGRGQTVKVPRGQASFTLDGSIHYDYGSLSGGSPPNEIMCEKLKEITKKINQVLGSNYNTILMNVYKDGKDGISIHKDNETGWAKGTGFATLSFGCERPFLIEKIDTHERRRILHKSGMVIEMPYPMNHFYYHAVPPCSSKIATTWRISLTFREIIPKPL
jgi:alkylated DNA repair dioxygenase AlkB